MMGYYYGGWSLAHGLGMGLLGLLFWGVVIGAAVLAARGLLGRGAPAPVTAPSALEILQMRYARGEIDRAEFEERKQSLTS